MEPDSLGSGLVHLDVLLPEITVAMERRPDRPARVPTRSAVAAKESMAERGRERFFSYRGKKPVSQWSADIGLVDVSNFGLWISGCSPNAAELVTQNS